MQRAGYWSHSFFSASFLTLCVVYLLAFLLELFEISALAGAAVELSEESSIAFKSEDLAALEDWIPKLEFGAAVQFREEVKFGNSTNSTGGGRRRLSSDDGHRNLVRAQDRRKLVHPLFGSSHRALHETNHSALPLLRSLASLGDEYGNVTKTDYNFTACPVNTTTESACAKIKNLRLDIGAIADMIKPVLEKIVDGKDGYLDKVVPPLKPLNEPIEPMEALTGQSWTILDVADIYVGKAKAGTDTVRKIIEIYDGIVSLYEKFAGGDDIILADECDILAGFACTGGLAEVVKNETRRLRRLQEIETWESIFVPVDRAGFNVTTAESAHHRYLAETPCYTKQADCNWTCTPCSGKAKKAGCNAAKLKCNGQNIEGLELPFLSDPMSLLELLKGGDIVRLFVILLFAQWPLFIF